MDDGSDPDGQVLKKVYFIKKAREGEELVTLLKNKFKTIDAIRDGSPFPHDVGEVRLVPPAMDGEPAGEPVVTSFVVACGTGFDARLIDAPAALRALRRLRAFRV